MSYPPQGTITRAELNSVEADLAAHGIATTAIHGVGALHIAGFHSAGQAVSKVVWKDASEEAVGDFARSVTLEWTDLDLTSYVSANAKFAILKLQQIIASVSGGNGYLKVRKKGTAPAANPVSESGADLGDIATMEKSAWVFVALDANKTIQYEIEIEATISIHSLIYVTGYIE